MYFHWGQTNIDVIVGEAHDDRKSAGATAELQLRKMKQRRFPPTNQQPAGSPRAASPEEPLIRCEQAPQTHAANVACAQEEELNKHPG